MRHNHLPIEALSTWVALNDVEFCGVKVAPLGARGSGVVATATTTEECVVVMRIPKELILSLDRVWIYAKSDKHLREVLEALGEYARTARGAILIFLLMQISASASSHSTTTKTTEKLGASNPFTDYVKFLPAHVPLPTYWTDDPEALDLLRGTTLKPALAAKMHSLLREFDRLRQATESIGWCQQNWWSSETGCLSFDDWKQVDAMYRSRALDLPGTGHAMVPCIDMANHAAGDGATALYETDPLSGDAILVLRDGKTLELGEEVTITYGDAKGACEMLFSYGFLTEEEEQPSSAQELFLDLEIPLDDPLKIAKMAVSDMAPGFRLFSLPEGGGVRWESSFVWLLVVNEEDGLEFRVMQTNDGDRELAVSWKGNDNDNDGKSFDVAKLEEILKADALWDVFNLRAIATLQDRVERQLLRLEETKYLVSDSGDPDNSSTISSWSTSPVKDSVIRLRHQEEALLLQAYDHFEQEETRLYSTPTVQSYLSGTAKAATTQEQLSSSGTDLEDDDFA